MAVFATLTMSGSAVPVVQQPARLMSFSQWGVSQAVCEVDPQAGQFLECFSTGGAAQSPVALAFANQWLYGVDWRYDQSTRLVRINPADGVVSQIGQVLPWGICGFCSDPSSGVLYCMAQSYPSDPRLDLFTIDANTGQATLAITDMTGFAGFPWAMAIDANGDGWFVTNSQTLYRLDLTTGNATFQGGIGGLPNVGSNGQVHALASASPGILYASYYYNGGPPDGFYRINTTTRTATKVSNLIVSSLAFAPGLDGVNYCTAKTNSLGCVPAIGGHGYASVSAGEGLDVWGENVLNATDGLLFYGVAGRSAWPWHGGTLCVRAPLTRTAVRSSGGDPWPAHNCTGRWSLDLNTALAALPPHTAGTVVDLQWFGRDPGFAPPDNLQLTDALEITLRP